jgi:DNA-binding NtrC family response regulator
MTGPTYLAGRVMAAILIVEDETQVRVLSESYLQNQGHETWSAANLDEALAVL